MALSGFQYQAMRQALRRVLGASTDAQLSQFVGQVAYDAAQQPALTGTTLTYAGIGMQSLLTSAQYSPSVADVTTFFQQAQSDAGLTLTTLGASQLYQQFLNTLADAMSVFGVKTQTQLLSYIQTAIVITPPLIDAQRLIAWHTADEVVVHGYRMKSTGTSPPIINYQGALSVPGGITIKCTSVAGGTGLGQAQISIYLDDGTTPIMANVLTAAAIVGTGLLSGVTFNCPAGPYATDNVWTTAAMVVIDQANLGGDIGSVLYNFAPTYEGIGWNGKPSLLWDGTQSLLYADGQDLANRVVGGLNKEFHLYASVQLLATTAATVMNFGNLTDNASGWTLSVGAGPVWSINKFHTGGDQATVTGGVPDTSRHILEFHNTGTVQTMLIDGTPVTLSGGGAMAVGDVGVLNASGLGLFKGLGASAFCNMRLRERVIFGAGHSVASQNAMRAYMTANN